MHSVGQQLRVKQIKSHIGRPQKQRDILRGMGLGKMQRSVYLKDAPEIRGMIKKVEHLVSVEECEVDQS